MLAVTVTSPARSGGSCSAPSSRSARATGNPELAPTVSTRNSSPANRATVSFGRTTADSRPATSWSSRSPAACPRVSLTRLKASRSMKDTATGCPVRAAAASDCSRRLTNSARLGSPVSGSCRIRWVSRRSASSRSLLIRCSFASWSVSFPLSRCTCCCCAFCWLRSVTIRQRSDPDDPSVVFRPTSTGVPVLVGLNTTEGSSGSLRCLIVTDLSQQKAQQQQVHRLNAKLTSRLAKLHRINSDLEAAERLLTYRTLHDLLTGLPNRTLFVNRLEQSLAAAARTGHLVAVSFIDLDAFKRVNDTLGHAAGDRLLQEVAERLSAVVRANDTVARFAGDEFLVLTIGATSGLPATLADRLLGALHEPPLRAGAETVTASMGLAVSYEGVAPEQLLREADAAMYHAKRAGGARWELFGSRLRDELPG